MFICDEDQAQVQDYGVCFITSNVNDMPAHLFDNGLKLTSSEYLNLLKIVELFYCEDHFLVTLSGIYL
uniref:Uncharacterized protein n=1 Tax=Lepeophtheirus salmonis TaxID=72036 RepID=A0A0K2UZ36_LEPSM